MPQKSATKVALKRISIPVLFASPEVVRALEVGRGAQVYGWVMGHVFNPRHGISRFRHPALLLLVAAVQCTELRDITADEAKRCRWHDIALVANLGTCATTVSGPIARKAACTGVLQGSRAETHGDARAAGRMQKFGRHP